MRIISSLTMLLLLVASVAMAQVIPDQYIVVLKDNAGNPGNAAQALANRHGGKVGHVYGSAIRGFSFHGSAAAAAAIANNPNVS